MSAVKSILHRPNFAAVNWCAVGGAMAGIAASPLIWNIIARNEYRHGTMTRVFGDKVRACYALAAWIFFSSLGKDKLVEIAIQKCKPAELFKVAAVPGGERTLKTVGSAMVATGLSLVVAAYYRLGITGTYLGDYFGILMSERVTKFPFNMFENPMYLGSTLSFLGLAVHENSPVGVFLAGWVYLVYEVSTRLFENPFTDMIYREKAKKDAAAKAE
jgi:methylene-fatty-acyl-phospholipid synthase